MSTDIDIALRLLDRGEYADAAVLLEPLAKAGNARAQSSLGSLFQLGQGVRRDYRQAVNWLKMAAAQGEGSAAHNLGTIYITGGDGIEANLAEAKMWYRRARDLGFEVANKEWYD
jgi:uncharacterized protein